MTNIFFINLTTETESDIPVLRELIWNGRHYARRLDTQSFADFLAFIVWLDNGCNKPAEYDGDITGDWSANEEAEKMWKIQQTVK